MKFKLLVLAFLFSVSFFAQNNSQSEKPDTPRIVSKLHFGDQLHIDDITLEFVKVVQDSRCPKDVTCIWAGEVVVLVDVFEKGTKIAQKTLTLSPTAALQTKLGNVFSTEILTVSGLNVLPYPTSEGKPNMEDYYIQLDIEQH